MIAPLQAHRFRIDLMGNEVLQQMTEAVSFDLVNKTVNIIFRESIDCRVMPIIMSLIDAQGLCMTWEALAPRTGDAEGTVMFGGLKIIAHSCGSDYNDSRGYVTHEVEMSYLKHEFIK